MDELTFRMLVILRSEPADGNTILERLRELDDGGVPSLPTLYRSIRSALEAKWIKTVGGKADGTPGRPRQVFRLTVEGATATEQEAQRLKDLAALAQDGSLAGESGKH